MIIRESNIRALVIGAAGFMGQHIVRALTDGGIPVVGLDWKDCPDELAGIDWITGTAFDEDTVSNAVRDCSHVIYLGGNTRPATSRPTLKDEIAAEVIGPVQVAEICSASGVRQFIFASSGGTVYGLTDELPTTERALTQPTNTYGFTKLMVEHALRLIAGRTSMACVVLRISNPYGPGQVVKQNQGFIAAAMEAALSGNDLPIWGDGSSIRDFIYVGDVARAFICAMSHEGRYLVVNISSGEGVSLLQICDEIADVTGQKMNIAFEDVRRADLPVSLLSNELAQSELSWSPGTSLRDGLKKTRNWWKARAAQGHNVQEANEI